MCLPTFLILMVLIDLKKKIKQEGHNEQHNKISSLPLTLYC